MLDPLEARVVLSSTTGADRLLSAALVHAEGRVSARSNTDMMNRSLFPGGPTYRQTVEQFFTQFVFPEGGSYKGVSVTRDNVIAERVETNGRGGWFLTVRARYSGRLFGVPVAADRVRVYYDNGGIRVDLGGIRGALNTRSIGQWVQNTLQRAFGSGGGGGGGSSSGNDTLATATNIGALATTRTATGSVGGSDRLDYFKFTAGAGQVRIDMTGLSQDIDFLLLNSRGQAIGSPAQNGGARAESKSYRLVGGTYYIKVYPGVSGAVSNYRLALTKLSSSGGGSSSGNDTLATATNIGALATTRTATGSVGGSDRLDYFKFTAGAGQVRIDMTGLSQDIDFLLLNSRGQAIGSPAQNGGARAESKSYRLVGGTYYIKVYPGVSGAVSNYRLALTRLSS